MIFLSGDVEAVVVSVFPGRSGSITSVVIYSTQLLPFYFTTKYQISSDHKTLTLLYPPQVAAVVVVHVEEVVEVNTS